MNVLQLGPVPPPEGGVSRNMMAIRDELIAAGHSCDVIATTRGGNDGEEAGIHRPASFTGLLKLLRRIKCDVLHLHVGGEISPKVLALMFACTAFGRGKKVLSIHSGAFPLTKAAIAARPASVQGVIFRRFDRIVVINESLEDVMRRYGVATESVARIMPYVLSEPDKNVNMPVEHSRFYAEHSPILLAVGGLEPDYDPLFQIAAMKDVLAAFPNAGLMIVGDGSIRQEVVAAAAASGYANNVCIAGNVSHDITLHLIRDACVLIRTTLFDGDAISIREALFLPTAMV